MTIATGNTYLDGLGGTATAAATKKNGTLDQAAFLRLLTTQMTTQDPFDPVDNTQMVAQMAQFSSTTGIAEMNQSLKTLVETMTASRVGDAASWIGKAALIESRTATALADGAFAGSVAVGKNASRIDISLSDAEGRIVYTASANDVKAGELPFYWDGKDDNGQPVAGPLSISVSALDETGQPLDAAVASWATVQGVRSPASGSTRLVTALGAVDPADALQLS